MIASYETLALGRTLETILPWHATGRLSPAEFRQIDRALARDFDLARAYTEIQRERATIVALNERLGAPSPRARAALFAAIDLEIALAKKSL